MKKLTKGRVIPATIYVVVVLLLLIINFLSWQQNQTYALAFHIISIISVSTIALLSIYELFKAFDLPKHLVIPIGVLTSLAWFSNSDTFFGTNYNIENLLTTQSNSAINELQFSFIVYQLKNWPIYVFWVVSMLILFFYYMYNQKQLEMSFVNIYSNVIVLGVALLLIQLFMVGLSAFLILSPPLALLLFALPIVVDTCGFFGGMLFGRKFIKRPLAPFISPKKTYEGLFFSILGGVIVVIAIFFIFDIQSYYVNVSNEVSRVIFPLYLAVILPIAAVLGDLMFSYIKRINNIKDYSRIMMDHGGILDRFDSMILVNFFMLIILLSL